MSKQSPLDHLYKQLRIWYGSNERVDSIYQEAKQIEKERDYETKAYWFGRGINAGREGTIEELKPIKP